MPEIKFLLWVNGLSLRENVKISFIQREHREELLLLCIKKSHLRIFRHYDASLWKFYEQLSPGDNSRPELVATLEKQQKINEQRK